MRNIQCSLLGWLVVFTVPFLCTPAHSEPVKPFPRQRLPAKAVYEWNLSEFAQKSPAGHECTLVPIKEGLQVKSTGADPFFELPEVASELPQQLLLRLKGWFRTGGPGRVYWRTRRSPTWSEQQARGFALVHDGKSHDYEIPLELDSPLLQLRLDPGETAGTAVIGSLELLPLRLHPLEIEAVETMGGHVRLDVRNHDASPLVVGCLGRSWTLRGNSVARLESDVEGSRPFESLSVEIVAADLPPIRRQLVIIRPEAQAEWKTLRSGALRTDVATDGSGARLSLHDRVIGYIAPLVHCDGAIPSLQLAEASERHLVFRGEGVSVHIDLQDEQVDFRIDCERACEGPVVRPVGELEQGLFAGIEYLGKSEQSSSTLDIETSEHLRFAPSPLQVTMPLAVCRTMAATMSLTWDDMRLEPRFAVPNFLDGAPGHRMSLRGRTIRATLRVAEESLEQAIVWAVRRRGLPRVPAAVRTPKKQKALCLAALEGPLHGPGGWGHCAEPNWGRAPYADMASTLFWLTGRVPDLKELVPDGSHLRNDSAYFLSGRVAKWREVRAGEAEAIRAQQQPDGSFRYDGPFRRGHFEDTASGYEAERAARMLDWAAATGDAAMSEAGMKSLERMRRFRTPRGALTWEVPLHTPDILASAWLVRAYLRGYELSGHADYLREATKWAITGVPFVYQWSERPVMSYATIGVLGATNWQAPNWIGLPVQWCGIVYADAITQLAKHDQTLDWHQLAEGFLRAAEQMQYPDGPFAGCLPDAFELAGQQRREAAINPCTLVNLRRRLDGETVGLCIAADTRHRIVAPFPVAIKGSNATIMAAAGIKYEVLIDGQRIVAVVSQGTDVIALDY